MPIEIKEVIVRAWVNSQGSEGKTQAKSVAKKGRETSELTAEMLEQMKKMLTDKKNR